MVRPAGARVPVVVVVLGAVAPPPVFEASRARSLMCEYVSGERIEPYTVAMLALYGVAIIYGYGRVL